jgi:hypothetical protein
MGYATLIKQQARSAFAKIGTLATKAVLTQANSSTFDFATQTTTKSAPVSTNVTIVVSKMGRAKLSKNTLEATVIMLKEDIDDLTLYDTIAFNGNTWNIVKPTEDDGYIATLKLTREYHG